MKKLFPDEPKVADSVCEAEVCEADIESRTVSATSIVGGDSFDDSKNSKSHLTNPVPTKVYGAVMPADGNLPADDSSFQCPISDDSSANASSKNYQIILPQS